VVQELRGEKIDIVPYDDDPARFVCNAIAPAEVNRVIIDAEGHRMELIVPDDKLSLAIGKKGQNVRLASQLTGWRIDIHSASKIRDLEQRAKRQIAAIDGVGDALAGTIFRMGWRSVTDVSRARPEELANIPDLDVDQAARIIEGAKAFLRADSERQQAARREAERRAALTDEEKLLELEDMTEELVSQLAGNDLFSVESLAQIREPDAVAGALGLDPHEVAMLVYRAQVWLGKLPANAPPPEPPAPDLAAAAAAAESPADAQVVEEG
jgi:N utilization substance protein A